MKSINAQLPARLTQHQPPNPDSGSNEMEFMLESGADQRIMGHTSIRPLHLLVISLAVATSLSLLGFPAFGQIQERPSAHRQTESQDPGRDPYRIALKSRTFTPSPGITQDAFEHTRRQLENHKRAHAMVQLLTIPSGEGREALQIAGIRLLSYVGGNTWFAGIANSQVLEFEKSHTLARHPILSMVRWIGKISAEDRTAPRLHARQIGEWARTADGKLLLVLTYHQDTDLGDLATRLASLSADVLGLVPEMRNIVISLDQKYLSDLAEEDGVSWIEPIAPPAQPESNRIRTHLQVNTVQAAPYNLNGQNVRVGIFEDYHAYAGHPDFNGRLGKGDTNSTVYAAHTTAMAGFIGGNGEYSGAGGGSFLQYRGMATNVSLFTYKYSPGGGFLTDFLEDLRKSIAEHQVDVANNSWGFSGCDSYEYGTYQGLCRNLDEVVRGAFGRPVSVVFSAGNERKGVWVTDHYDTHCIPETSAPYRNYQTLNHPKSTKNILVVGGIDSSNNRMSSYSNWGPTDDGRIKPELVASGHHSGIVTSEISDPTAASQLYLAPYYPTTTAYYGYNGMTSGAAAAASGCIALLLQDYRNLLSTTGNPLPSTVKGLLIHSAQDLDDSTSWYNRGPDYSSGYGLIRILDAINLMRSRLFHEGEITTSETADHYSFWTEPGQTQVKVTLVWDDVPGAENANPALVNDLDLVVVDPDGKRYYPWTLDPANPSADAVRTVADHRNNVEQVLVDTTLAGGQIPSGTWTLRVQKSSVPEPPQRYSLITSHSVVHGRVDTSFNPSAGKWVKTAAVQPDGQILVGGDFTSMGGTARNYMARLLTDGTLDLGFNPNPSNYVNCVAVQADGKILLGGSFTTVGGTTRNGIARINPNGGLDSTFNPSAYNVSSVAPQTNGQILIGGSFTSVGGTPRGYVARLNADGSLDSSFNPNVSHWITCVAVQPDGKILIAGMFLEVNLTSRKHIARLNPDGTLDTGFNPNVVAFMGSIVSTLAIQPDGKILMGGYFNTVGGTARTNLARLLADGSVDASFSPVVSSEPSAIVLQADGKILLGGIFSSVAGTARSYLARVNPDGTLDAGFDPNPNFLVKALALQTDGQILVGGNFTAVGGVTRNYIARLLNGPASQTLSVPDPTRVQWLRSGTAPEVAQVTFELSTNSGSTWTMLGSGTRITGGWTKTSLNLPLSGSIRARGQTASGIYNGSSGLIEQITGYSMPGSAPEIVSQPTNQTVYAGQSATCTVSAIGSSPLFFQWRFNGTNLPGATTTDCRIPIAQLANQGGYSVEVSNAFGCVTSAVATLTVVSAGTPQLSVNPTTLKPLCFRGRVADGGSFEVWNRGGGQMDYTIGENVTWLSCAPSGGGSTGERDPIAMNYWGAGLAIGIYTGTITVTAPGASNSPQVVNVGLEVLSRPKVIRAYISKPTTLTIEWTGGPGVWLERASQPHGPAWTVVPGSEGLSRMELPLTEPAAFFRAAATAESGNITQHPTHLAVAQGSPANFSVVATGNPAPAYQWRLNGVGIPGANNSIYSIAGAQSSQVGEYTVVVSFGSLAITSNPATLVLLAPYGHLVWIPAGTFVMGSPSSETDRWTNEGPQTTVTLRRGFWMGTYEVTQREYVDLTGGNPSHFTSSLDLPVEFMSWTDATDYCKILTQRERTAGRIPGSFAYRLPTEAEWEYACRAQTTTRFSYGDDPGYGSLATYGWYIDNSGDTTHQVGGKLPNPWGLYDMHGNVWEWCQDWLSSYPGGSVIDPLVSPPTGSYPIVRGGSYYYGGAICRSAKRGAMDPPTGMRWDVGFRVVLGPMP